MARVFNFLFGLIASYYRLFGLHEGREGSSTPLYSLCFVLVLTPLKVVEKLTKMNSKTRRNELKESYSFEINNVALMTNILRFLK